MISQLQSHLPLPIGGLTGYGETMITAIGLIELDLDGNEIVLSSDKTEDSVQARGA